MELVHADTRTLHISISTGGHPAVNRVVPAREVSLYIVGRAPALRAEGVFGPDGSRHRTLGQIPGQRGPVLGIPFRSSYAELLLYSGDSGTPARYGSRHHFPFLLRR
jgi:hypothetical protein